MDILLHKATINEKKLYMYIKTVASQELSNLTTPCYYPKFKKYENDLLKLTGLTSSDINEFPERFYNKTIWKKFQLHNDKYSCLLLFIMYYFIQQNNMPAFSMTMLFYNIKQYSNLFHARFKFCKEEVFKYVLDNLSSLHLFKREKTIGNAINFLSIQYVKKYYTDFKKKNVDSYGKFVQESRKRISQSLISFAKLYYTAEKTYSKPVEYDEIPEEIPVEKGTILIDKFVKTIITYRQVDKKALTSSYKSLSVNKDLCNSIIKELSNIKYNDNLKLISKLLLIEVKDLNSLCSTKFKSFINELMSIKRTTKKLYFKQQVNVLVIAILKNIKEYNDYQKLNSRNKYLINLFLARYICFSFQNFLCH